MCVEDTCITVSWVPPCEWPESEISPEGCHLSAMDKDVMDLLRRLVIRVMDDVMTRAYHE
ncbi:hypothetical protein A2U01_0041598, partial [Trifolium medium]|nr:hypothetical protein [Trifolium medium]